MASPGISAEAVRSILSASSELSRQSSDTEVSLVEQPKRPTRQECIEAAGRIFAEALLKHAEPTRVRQLRPRMCPAVRALTSSSSASASGAWQPRRVPRDRPRCQGVGLTCLDVDDASEKHAGRVTVFDRLTAAGLSPDRVRWWLDQGGVRVDDEVVTEADSPAAPPARVVLRS